MSAKPNDTVIGRRTLRVLVVVAIGACACDGSKPVQSTSATGGARGSTAVQTGGTIGSGGAGTGGFSEQAATGGSSSPGVDASAGGGGAAGTGGAGGVTVEAEDASPDLPIGYGGTVGTGGVGGSTVGTTVIGTGGSVDDGGTSGTGGLGTGGFTVRGGTTGTGGLGTGGYARSGGTIGTGGMATGGRTGSGGTTGAGGVIVSGVDLVFMIDNSPSMAPKVAKVNARFAELISALKDPSSGALPDLHVAIIDSDLGSGGAYPNGTCGPKTLPDGVSSLFGDLGRFQMLKDPTDCPFDDGALFLDYRSGAPQNFAGDIGTVITCLAGNVGTLGCGLEHTIQAFEFALAAKGIGNEEQQTNFLRPNALLGLVFLTDEDDCSAATDDYLFGDKPELRGEAASLRCATRAHFCSEVGNLADNGPHYPTIESFEAPFETCTARMGDECGQHTDTSVPTDCNPLKSVRGFAEEIKALKGEPDRQILVAGVFGWPRADERMSDARYKIALIPNPNTADTQHPRVYDSWPVCYDPDHPPSSPDPTTGFDTDAAGWGATGGLRNAAFVDEFGTNGLKFSICERDFGSSMAAIGEAIADRLR